MTHQRVTTSYVSTTMRVREGEMGWGCGGGACRPNAREVKCFLVWAGLRKREVVAALAHAGTSNPGFFSSALEREQRESMATEQLQLVHPNALKRAGQHDT